MKRALLAICCAGTTLLGFNPASANEEVINLTHLPSNWALPTGNYANWRYSELYQITSANVWQLKHVATLPIDADSFNEGSPLVINDTMYLVTKYPHKVYAFDIKGIGGGQFKLKWKYEPKLEEYQQPLTHVGIANRGLAYADGKIILQRLDGMVVALKASTTNPDGEVVWSAQNGISGNGESNTAAVMPVKDKVIVGLAAAERTARCHLTAYNLKTGQRVWRAFSVGPDEDTLIDATTTYLGKPVGAIRASKLG